MELVNDMEEYLDTHGISYKLDINKVNNYPLWCNLYDVLDLKGRNVFKDSITNILISWKGGKLLDIRDKFHATSDIILDIFVTMSIKDNDVCYHCKSLHGNILLEFYYRLITKMYNDRIDDERLIHNLISRMYTDDSNDVFNERGSNNIVCRLGINIIRWLLIRMKYSQSLNQTNGSQIIKDYFVDSILQCGGEYNYDNEIRLIDDNLVTRLDIIRLFKNKYIHKKQDKYLYYIRDIMGRYNISADFLLNQLRIDNVNYKWNNMPYVLDLIENLD